jgi:fatty acid amide hydrolase 2
VDRVREPRLRPHPQRLRPARTAGGSSGGEGAAVGSGGSPVGLGSDIAGSIRVPAFFNGVFGHKPSPGLVPNTGQFPTTGGEAAYMLTLGPLARHAGDLMPVTRIVSGPDGQDPGCVERALGDPEAVDLASVRVLLADDASLVPARRELRDARDHAAQALRDAGARCERVSLKQLRRALELFLAALGDGADVTLDELLEQAGSRPRGMRSWGDALRGRGDHTTAILITLAVERVHRHMPAGRTRRALAAAKSLREEVAGILGADAVLLHQPRRRWSSSGASGVGVAGRLTNGNCGWVGGWFGTVRSHRPALGAHIAP